jgi:hypothetical protein
VELDISDSCIQQCASKDASYLRNEELQDNDHPHADILQHDAVTKDVVADDVEPVLYRILISKLPRNQSQHHPIEIDSQRQEAQYSRGDYSH